MTQHSVRYSLLQWTDQCVLCGLCLASCPTYLASRNEAESPRGRISLIRALAQEQLEADSHFIQHIDQCTGCLRCERVCPAKVDYSSILDYGRQLQRTREGRWQRLKKDLVRFTLEYRSAVWLASRLARVAQRLRLPMALPLDTGHVPCSEHIEVPFITSVFLFAGCTGKYFDQVTLESAQQLLHKLGVHAITSNEHLCCGALAQHAGQPVQAQQQLRKTLNTVHSSGIHRAVSIATGCAAHLYKYAPQQNHAHDLQIQDVTSFLLQHAWPENLSLTTSRVKVFLHTPCSTSYLPDNGQVTLKLLQKIPGVEVIMAQQTFGCCGAGGLNLLTQRAMGDRVVEPLVQEILTSGAQIVLSANIGCQLQLRRALEKSRTGVQVMHPVTLINQRVHHA